jgi:heme exporter protein D
MYFDSLQAALLMDGHGAFVWSAYGICLLVLGLLLSAPRRRRRRLLARVRGDLKREAAHAARERSHASGA